MEGAPRRAGRLAAGQREEGLDAGQAGAGVREDRARARHADRHLRALAHGGDGARVPRGGGRAHPRARSRCARCCARCGCGRSRASCSTSPTRSTAPRATRASSRPSCRRWMAGDDVARELDDDMARAREPLPAARALDHKLANWSGGRRYTCPSYEVVRLSDGVRIAVPGFQPFAAYDVVLANLDARPRPPRGPVVGRPRSLSGPARRWPPRRSPCCATPTCSRRARSSGASRASARSAPTDTGRFAEGRSVGACGASSRSGTARQSASWGRSSRSRRWRTRSPASARSSSTRCAARAGWVLASTVLLQIVGAASRAARRGT